MHRKYEGPDTLPWREIIAAALGVLRYPPEMFWQMTPKEFIWAMRGATGAPAGLENVSREELRRMLLLYPDGGRHLPEASSSSSARSAWEPL